MEREQMIGLTRDAVSLSEKIRILNAAGVATADIARFIDRRYQHVRNVLLREQAKAAVPTAPVLDDATSVFTAVLTKGGTVVLPAKWLAGEQLEEGDELVFRREADGLKIMTQAAAEGILLEVARRRMPGEAALLESILRSAERSRKT